MEQITKRVCSKKDCERAGEMLDVSQFRRKSDRPWLFASQCIGCDKIRQERWRQKNIKSVAVLQ